MTEIAVLVLWLVAGAFSQSLDCNFENKFCNYKQDKTDNFDWTWNKRGTGGINTGPATDHTSQTPAPTLTVGGNANGASCVFPFTYRSKKYTSCIQTGHNYLWCGTTKNYDVDKKWGNCIPKGVWPLGCYKDARSPRALPVLITYVGGNSPVNQCQIRVKARGYSVFSVENGNECWSGPSAHLTYDRYGKATNCKNGVGGGWANSVYVFRGWYALITQPKSSSTNGVARLISPTVTATGSNSKCLRFWYHIYGPHIDSLRVYTNSSYNSSLGYPIWQKTGTQGLQWKEAVLTVQQPLSFTVVFEATRKTGFKGNIAIDDVTFKDGACPATVGSCDFQRDLCGFAQDNTDDFDWTRKRGATGTTGTGPTVDHTLNSRRGYYVYTEVSGQRNGAKARIMKSYLKTTSKGRCLQFYYMMYGRDLGTLNVYQKVGNNLGRAIFSKSGDAGQGRRWLKGQATLNSTVDFMVVFEGIRGSGIRSDVAIDDVKVVEGSCGNPGDCNFQNGWCTWSNDKSPKDNFDWITGSGGTPSYLTGPSRDRLGSTSGKSKQT